MNLDDLDVKYLSLLNLRRVSTRIIASARVAELSKFNKSKYITHVNINNIFI